MLYTCLRWSASARAHVHTPLPYLANGWADCVQTWCVANDPLDERLTQVRCGVHLHVRTCTPPSNDGASSPARPSPIKASYWYYILAIAQFVTYSRFKTRWMRAAVHLSRAVRRQHEDPTTVGGPAEALRRLASLWACDVMSEEMAERLDGQDKLAAFRSQFQLPKMKTKPGGRRHGPGDGTGVGHRFVEEPMTSEASIGRRFEGTAKDSYEYSGVRLKGWLGNR